MIHLGMPVDNLSVDQNGDIWAAALPKLLKVLESFGDPYNIDWPTTVWRMKKTAEGYKTDKILEDAEATVVGSATVVRDDVKTGKLFMSGRFRAKTVWQRIHVDASIGAVAPYLTICEPDL